MLESVVQPSLRVPMSYRAFTLLETLIVLVIMVMFMAFSAPFFTGFAERSKLETAARGVTSALRTTRGFAITNNRGFYVEFDTGVTPHEYGVMDTVGTATDYTDDTEMDKMDRLPAGVLFQNIGFTDNRAIFTTTGALSESGSRTVEVTDGANTKTITVTKTTGAVKIN